MSQTSTLIFKVAALTAGLLTAPCAWALSACSSDGQPQPVALLERFISADCLECWSDPGTPAGRDSTSNSHARTGGVACRSAMEVPR